MVTTVFLVRHGETEGSDTLRYKGSIDVPLSETGIRQMKEVSVFIRNVIQEAGYRKQDKKNHESDIMYRASPELLAVYCSSLSRAVKSAEILAEPHGLIPLERADLNERNFGIWEGMSFSEIKEKYPKEFRAWVHDPFAFSPIGGESTLDVEKRVIATFEKIVKNHRGEYIAVVSHGGVNRVILCHYLGIPLKNIFRIEQDYAAVNIIEFWDTYPVFKLINGRVSF